MSRPWSSELAAALRRDREELLVLFVAYRSRLRDAAPTEFAGGEDNQARLLQRPSMTMSRWFPRERRHYA